MIRPVALKVYVIKSNIMAKTHNDVRLQLLLQSIVMKHQGAKLVVVVVIKMLKVFIYLLQTIILSNSQFIQLRLASKLYLHCRTTTRPHRTMVGPPQAGTLHHFPSQSLQSLDQW